MPVPTKDETDRSSQYKSYFRGFRDGVATTAMRKSFTEKPADDMLRIEYEMGYTDGYTALGAAMSKTGTRLHHKPSILRTAGDG